MPLIDIPGPDARKRRVREPYDPAHYTASPATTAKILKMCQQGDVEELLGNRDSMLTSYRHIGDVTHRGARYARLISNERNPWLVDVAYAGDEVLPVPPEEAWRIAREGDAREQPPIELASG